MFLVRGCVAFALGTALLASDSGLSRLATFLAVYWIVGAVLTLRWAARRAAGEGRRVGTVAGVIGLVAGGMLLLREPIHALTREALLLDLLGLTAVAMGLLRLAGTFHDDQLSGDSPRARYRLVVGTIDVVLGIALILASDNSASDLRLVLGIWGLLTGTFLLLDGLRLRRFVRSRASVGA